MSQKRVLVVYKESAYSQYLTSRQLTRGLRKGGYWGVVIGSHQRHNQTLTAVRESLKARGLSATLVLRERVHRLKDVDGRFHLVVTVGGDGTFLDSSHYIRRIPILGVNSDPSRSVARFSGCDRETFPRVLSDYLSGRLKPVPVPRLEFSVNGRPGRWPVLNDLLISTLSPAGTSRYILKSGRRAEEQMSSGLWISTAAGSTAAILSAGGRVLPVTARRFQYVVREVYQKKFGPRHLLQGVLGSGKSLEVISRMKEGRIFADGANLVALFTLGDRLAVRLSKRPLWVVGLRD
jgi:NAD+ kinase